MSSRNKNDNLVNTRPSLWLRLSASPGLVCMKSSSSVVELVMLLCSQASLYLQRLPPPPASPADLIYQVHLECRKSERIVSQPTPYLCRALPRHSLGPSESGGEAEREGISASKILVWGSRVVDLSTSPLTRVLALAAWPKLMRRDNVDLMVLCIDYPSPSCCLVGVCCQVYLASVWIHEY